MFLVNSPRASRRRFLSLVIVLLSASAARGQVLLSSHNFQVYEEEFSFFNSRTSHFQGTSTHYANYLLTSNVSPTGALLVRRYGPFDTPYTSIYEPGGGVVCQVSGLKYSQHQYEDEVLRETYSGRYKVYQGGTVPPAHKVPDLSTVQVAWEAHKGDEYVLRVVWFLPKLKSDVGFFRSYYVYTLRCHALN